MNDQLVDTETTSSASKAGTKPVPTAEPATMAVSTPARALGCGSADGSSPLSRRPVRVTVLVLACCGFYGQVLWHQLSSTAPKSRRAGGVAEFQVDLNKAPGQELALLPGVGPVLASRIVAQREQLGHFADWHQLDQVAGIGPKTLQQIQPWCLPLTNEIVGPLRVGDDQAAHRLGAEFFRGEINE